MITLTTVVFWILGLLVIWTLFSLLIRLTEYLWRPQKTAIGEFLVDGQASPSFATKFHDRWLSFRSSGDRIWLASGLPAPGGTDFILADVEQRSASELEHAIGEIGKDLDLKVAGVSVQGLARVLDSFARPAGRRIDGRISRFGNEVSLTITLEDGGRPRKVWSTSRTVPAAKSQGAQEAVAGKTPDGQAAAEEALIDEAICEVALYLKRTENPAAGTGEETMADATEMLSARAFAELKKGRRSLERYVQDNQQDDLLAAQKHFRSLVASSPAYTDGYLLLSQALAENRQEREAIEVYERALELLKPPQGAPHNEREFEARFLQASSRLRCYRWADAIQAYWEFDALAKDLEEHTKNKPNDKGRLSAEQQGQLLAWRQNRYMLARTYAESAHCLGHLQILLPKDRSIRAEFLPGLVRILDDDVIKSVKDPDTLADRRRLADRIYARGGELQAKSRQVDPIYKKEWKADLDARLSEVRGYAQFRHAEWLPANRDDAYKKECTDALRSLEHAELRNPRQYALLQNIGSIYLNRRFDPEGEDLARAEEYYLRSLELKPGDYFGDVQLARFGLSRALRSLDTAERKSDIDQAQERVAKALKLRPESVSARFLKAYLHVATLALGDQPAGAQDLDSLLTQFDRLDPDESDISYRWMRLLCGWLRLLAAADKTAFDTGKKDLKARMQKFVQDVTHREDAVWRVARMREAIARFAEKLDSLTYENRFKPRFELDAALE